MYHTISVSFQQTINKLKNLKIEKKIKKKIRINELSLRKEPASFGRID